MCSSLRRRFAARKGFLQPERYMAERTRSEAQARRREIAEAVGDGLVTLHDEGWKRISKLDGLAKGARRVARHGVGNIGRLKDGIELVTADNRSEKAAEVIGGAVGGAALGALGGAVGGPIGAVAGNALGSYVGEQAGEWLYDNRGKIQRTVKDLTPAEVRRSLSNSVVRRYGAVPDVRVGHARPAAR
jgi:phage tail tape-measure protein